MNADIRFWVSPDGRPALAAAAIFVLAVLNPMQRLIPPIAMAALAAVAVVPAIRARGRLRPGHLAVSLLGASLLIRLVGLRHLGGSALVGAVLDATSPVVAGWALVLALPASRSHPADEKQVANTSWLARGVAVSLVALGLFALCHAMLRGDFVGFNDEPLYLLQSRLMTAPGFARAIDQDLRDFFLLRQTIFEDGRLYTQYPPGHPAFLMLFDAVGLRWWTGVVLSAASVLFTFLLGRELRGSHAGVMAAVLLALNPFFILYSTGYFAHAPSVACVTAAAWLLVRSERQPYPSGAWHWAVAGLLLGTATAIRPLSGAGMTLSLVLWHVVHHFEWRRMAWSIVALGAGAALPLGGLLAFNQVTNGSPFTFGYTLAQGSLHALGFGLRGWHRPMGHDVVNDFTPWDAVVHSADLVADAADTFLPMLAIGVPLALVLGGRWSWRVVLGASAFLVLPVAHFFYFSNWLRFYIELFPFVLVAFAGVLVRLSAVDRRGAALLLAVCVTTQAARSGLALGGEIADQRISMRRNVFAEIGRLEQQPGKFIIFADDEDVLQYVSWVNIDAFPGRLIGARDRGDGNVRLLATFPEHRPLYAVRRGDEITFISQATFSLLTRPAAAP